MNSTLETVDGRPTVRCERRLGHPVERVWRAITEPEELRRWSPAVPRWRPEADEEFTSEDAEGAGRIVTFEPPRLLAYEWERDSFRFELEPDGEGCRLVFTHVIDDPALGPPTATGWVAYFDRLDVHLAGEFLSEEDAHRTVALDDGPKLRIERRYGHSVERVWRAITDPDELRHWFPVADIALEVTESEPPHVLAGTWHGDVLRFELTPHGDGCVLAFSHAFADRAKAARDAAGWDVCFVRLGALLAGTPMDEADSLRLWPPLHERYAERFGVDPELGRRAYADHSSRS
jgi:uncharacterized protein YndB with AHSA1/START domain